MVARRHAGYAVAMEVARQLEGTEVNGKTMSRCSLGNSSERAIHSSTREAGGVTKHNTLATLCMMKRLRNL